MSAFRPGWLPSVLVLLLFPCLIALGFWQLERAEEKRELLAAHQAQQLAAPISIAELERQSNPAYQRVQLQGFFDARHTLLLDNRTRDGKVGVEVLQPFYDQASGLWLLLNRGWFPRGRSRDQLPEIPALPETLSVAGRSYVYSDKVFTLAEDDLSQPSWPLRVQRVDMARLGQLLGIELAPFEVRAEPGEPLETGAQMVRDWTGSMMTPDRHRAYALQWFAMAAALVILLVLAAWRQRRQSDREMDA